MASTDDVSQKRAELERCPPGEDDRDVALFNLACALHERYDKEEEIDDLNEAITFHRAALSLRPVGNDDRSLSLLNLAFCLGIRYDQQGAVDDLEEAITLERDTLELSPPGHYNHDVCLYNLATHLEWRFRQQADMRDLDEVIDLHRAVLELYPPGHPERSSSLDQLALCLLNRYEDRGMVDDLDEVVTLRRAALELCPRGHPDHGESLHNLACDLRRRFTAQAAIRDLEESIELLRSALELRPPGHPDRSSTFHELALCLSNRYDKLGTVDDLEEAIVRGRAALDLHPPEHADRDESLHDLACALRKRFVKQATIHDLEEAIELHHAALELRPSGNQCRSSSLRGLALCLSNRYDKLGVVDDLEEAITLERTALELCPLGHADHGASLHNLACDLRKRFTKKAVISDLQEAIELLRPALKLRPIGHPDRSSSLHELALCLSNRHDKLGVVDDLEEAIALGGAALELCPTGHLDRGVVLYSLACNLWKKFQKQADMPELCREIFLDQAASVVCPTSRVDVAFSLSELSLHLWVRFQKQATMADLDNAICLATCAVELRLPHEDVSVGAWVQRVAQGAGSGEPVILGQAANDLCVLANCHRARYQTQHAIVDLNEAITYYRYMLQLRPAGHPSRASSLHDLAQCLADRFRRQSTTVDLDDAIVLEQEVLDLLVRGDPGYDESRVFLTTYLQMKFSSQVATMSTDASSVTLFDIKQVIRNVAFEILKTVPTRLLHTPTGILCNRDAQVSQFMNSQQYKRLVSLCTTRSRAQQMELIHTNVSRHFQYVTLSHRWGEAEPSLRDIEGHPIYGMSTKGGFGKLQAFCRVALERDYIWAWSDTCCIDKHSSAEVQETIGSMFVWYRQSALTIVYLSDVPSAGFLGNSEWFRRGWTLQELLAPKITVFYTQDWSLYKNLTSSNHKTDVAVLEELERATGIESRFLANFSPGMDDARSRLQWASSRRTTRPEDIAYSLFGIFNVHLPVLYGESAENATGRLLAEIISDSGDISVLDWVGEASSFHSCLPAHITSYQILPSPRLQPNSEEQSLAISQGLSSFEVLRNFATSLLPQFLSRSLRPSSITPADRLRIPDSYAPSDVYDFNSFTRAPLPRFRNRCLILPCIAHLITAAQLRGEDLSAPSYTYKIQARGLRPLEIELPDKLESATISQGALQLVRPWHSRGQSAALDATSEGRLLLTLGRPFNALLLIEVPHSQYKRIASSTLITAQPADSASILKSKVRIFHIV
ncbi:hypothetical protein BKA82DRAFT_996781 [Pisolithus tinctorius]|uniref:Heterokaryon incompatibility domain-containing protein n=1 Tax=Pisolithus tinctorius Marx 270 TaxID=870435 RepID=A0A0C3PLD0_PISTI|nr:hypothetical protein BKA82DRAFT_996781 [Pisolithus tinctorius]KIO09094.1 hypothetical protein M404DRAFT_996781 [Pisolithus tinctorius Marx 270]